MRLLTRLVPRLKSIASKSYSTKVDVDFDPKAGYAVVRMNSPPVNVFGLDLNNELRQQVLTLENDSSCHGIILTSGVKGVFSAGLDITEMYNAKYERLADYWRSFQALWHCFYTSKLVIMAAINGNSPAGGCVIANTADYRVMSKAYAIGLNEAKLGLSAPFWATENFTQIVGHREAERSLQLGQLYSSTEALGVGLVDELVDGDDPLDATKANMDEWLSVPAPGRQTVKSLMREDLASKFSRKQDECTEETSRYIMSEPVQKTLEVYWKMLKARHK